MQRPANTRVDLSVAREIAAREGIKAIVTGDVTGLGAGYVIGLRLVSADSGALLASYQTTVNGPADLVAGVDVVAKKLRGKMGESLRSVQSSPPLERVTTTSLAALRDYGTGSRENDVTRDYIKSVEYLRHAVLLDSNFAMAWRKLGVALGNARYPQSSADSALTRAHLLADRLTAGERLAAEAYYYDHGPGRDRAKAIAAYEDLLKRGDSSIAPHNLALDLTTRRDFARAESLYRAFIRLNPGNALTYGNLVSTLGDAGEVDEARSVAAEIRKRFPTNPTPTDLDINLAYDEGRFDQLKAILDTARRSSTRLGKRSGLVYSFDFALLRGRLGEARQYVLAGIALDSAAGISFPGNREYDDIYFDGWFHGPSETLVRRVDSLVPLLQLTTRPYIDRPYTTAATAYAIAGAPEKARMMLARMRNEIKDTAVLRYREQSIHGIQGVIALAERRGDEAVTEFRQADRLPDGPSSSNPRAVEFDLGRAFDLANKPDSSIVHFERYLNTPYVARLSSDGFDLAGVYKRLGEMYEAKGNRAKAESYLSKFVELWKDADPELQPKVKDAKDRLARLAATGKS
jgi:tetratricopeptide (TPR) repeat protein